MQTNPTDPSRAQQQVLATLRAYIPADAAQQAARAQFIAFAQQHAHCCERSLQHGHFTASAWLVSADGQRVLLTHHRKLADLQQILSQPVPRAMQAIGG